MEKMKLGDLLVLEKHNTSKHIHVITGYDRQHIHFTCPMHKTKWKVLPIHIKPFMKKHSDGSLVKWHTHIKYSIPTNDIKGPKVRSL